MNKSEDYRAIRRRIAEVSFRNGMSHMASAFSCIEMIGTLFDGGFLEGNHFILSKGHAAIGYYAFLERDGRLEDGELDSYLKPNTRIGGEPCKRDLDCVEASTGSLGHGLSIGIGIALAEKMNGSNSRIYVLIGDGECEEGSIWEAAMSASAYNLDNMVVILDDNRLQKMSRTDVLVPDASWEMKWSSFGWTVMDVDGHDVVALSAAFSSSNQRGRPYIIIAHTIKGKGVEIMENNVKWHFRNPTEKEKEKIMRDLCGEGFSQ